MSTPEDRTRHKTRIRRKQREKKREVEIKDLKKDNKVIDKHGKVHDLSRMNFRALVEAIQED